MWLRLAQATVRGRVRWRKPPTSPTSPRRTKEKEEKLAYFKEEAEAEPLLFLYANVDS